MGAGATNCMKSYNDIYKKGVEKLHKHHGCGKSNESIRGTEKDKKKEIIMETIKDKEIFLANKNKNDGKNNADVSSTSRPIRPIKICPRLVIAPNKNDGKYDSSVPEDERHLLTKWIETDSDFSSSSLEHSDPYY